MTEKEKLTDMIEDVFKRTDGGYKLSPYHYSLLRLAAVHVNDMNHQVIKAFENLYEQVINNKYIEPWLHGIEGMTVDHSGFIKFEGNIIEHFDLEYAYESESIPELLVLKERCMYLKEKNIDINIANTVYNFDEISKSRVDNVSEELNDGQNDLEV